MSGNHRFEEEALKIYRLLMGTSTSNMADSWLEVDSVERQDVQINVTTVQIHREIEKKKSQGNTKK